MARSRIVIIILEALIALALAFAIVFTLRTVANAEEPRKPEKQPFPVPIWECGDATVYHKQPSRLDRTLKRHAGSPRRYLRTISRLPSRREKNFHVSETLVKN
jgi:hypothetical protein